MKTAQEILIECLTEQVGFKGISSHKESAQMKAMRIYGEQCLKEGHKHGYAEGYKDAEQEKGFYTKDQEFSA